MPDNRPARGRMIYAVPAMAILPFVLIYFWAYHKLGSRTTAPIEIQTYQHEWQGRLFTPAVKIESIIRQKPIDVDWVSESPWP